MQPAVSVIIPVYKAERYIDQCLESVLSQDLEDFEVILVDDASPDSSGEICDAYAARDSRVRVIHQENRGSGGARNTGMDAARGEYIWFVDSDDYIESSALSLLLGESERTGADIVSFSLRVFEDTEDGRERTLSVVLRTVSPGIAMRGVDHVKETMSRSEYDAKVMTKFFRRSYLNSLGLRFEEGVIYEDESFSLITQVKAERMLTVEKVLYSYRQQSSSVMHTSHLDLSRSFRNLTQVVGQIIDVLDGRACGGADPDQRRLMIRYLEHLFKYMLKRFSDAPSGDRRAAAEAVEAFCGPGSGLYRFLSGKTRLLAKDPLLIAPFYRTYRDIRQPMIKRKRAKANPFHSDALRAFSHRLKGIRLKNRDVSIICNNCAGSIISHDLGLPFRSPTVNLYMEDKDFIEFAGHLEHYLSCDIEEVFERFTPFPVGVMRRGENSVRLYFMHYKSFDEAVSAWKRRAVRVDRGRIFIVMSLVGSEISPEVVRGFEALPFENKVLLAGAEAGELEYLKGVKEAVFIDDSSAPDVAGKVLTFRDRFNRYLDGWDYISAFNSMKRQEER
jgi:glycosyltransferase involved in cell wall biosynthesis